MRATIRDRPDVLLTLPFGLVGIEITEGLPADWARVDALREHSQIEGVTFLSRFRPKQPARNKSEIAFMASGRDQGSAWGGDSTERDWAEAMAHSVEIKTAKSRRPGFVRFDANWLLIYDGWPLPRVDMQKASAKLLSHLNEFSAPAAFDRIFIESQKEIWQFSADAATSVPIVDLWL